MAAGNDENQEGTEDVFQWTDREKEVAKNAEKAIGFFVKYMDALEPDEREAVAKMMDDADWSREHGLIEGD